MTPLGVNEMRDYGDEVESTVTRDGITVYQTYEEERFGVPTVVLKFVSEREDAAEVQIAVGLPPNLAIEEVGFHPDYHREDWTVASDRLSFAAEIGPEEEVTTMYAVESLVTDQLDSLLDGLTIEHIAGDTAESEFDPEHESQPSRSISTVPTDSVSAEDLKTKAEADPVADDQKESAPDGVDSDKSTAERAADVLDGEREKETEHDDEAGDEADGTETVSEGEVVFGEVVGETNEAVGEGAGEGEQTGATPVNPELADVSTATLLGEIQSRMRDVEENVTKIEDFNTRHGRPAEAFAELQNELAALDERVGDIEGDVDSLAEGQDELESKVSTLREWRNRIKSTLSALGE